MRVLFMGTPDFAVPTLEALVNGGFEVIGAVSQPDKPRGRGHHLMPTPVKAYAESQGIAVYQPATLKGEEFAELLARLDPEVIVVVAYNRLQVLFFCPYTTFFARINLHKSASELL